MHIDFLGIQAFLAIIEFGSFQQAAEHLHLTQTAISHRMRKLEDALGVPLVTRISREVSITEAGRTLLPRARHALGELHEVCETVRKHGENANNWLTIGCIPTLANTVLIEALHDFSKRWPERKLRIFDSTIGEIYELVQSHAAAFGISVLQRGHQPTDLKLETVAQEPFVLLCPSDHRLASGPEVGWQDLVSEKLIRISMSSGNSLTIDDSLGPLREQLSWRLEAQHTPMAVQMVKAGMGLTIVPLLSASDCEGVQMLPLHRPVVTRTIVTVSRQGAQLSAAERGLQQACVKLLKKKIRSTAVQPKHP